jgi:hypothetical protein
MTGQRTTTQKMKSAAGWVLVGPGLFILFGRLVGVVHQLRALEGNVAGQGISVFSSMLLSATLDQHWWLEAFLGLLWPLPLVISGAVLLKDETDDSPNRGKRGRAGMPDPCGCVSEPC